MIEWQKYTIEDIANVQNGYAFKSDEYILNVDTALEVLKMGHIERGGGLRKSPKKDFVPRNEKLKKWVLDKDDIVMAMTDMKDNVVILGVPALIDKNNHYVLNQRVARIVVKDRKLIDINFLFNYLKWDEFLLTLQSKASSGVQVNLSTETIKNSVLLVPKLEEQKAIASVLSSLDDKIDLLHRQNNNLEAMAETLFRQRFVEESEEDWEFVELGEYLDCFNGVSYKSSELNPSKVAMVTLKSFDRNGGFRLDGFKEFTGRFKEQHVVTQGDLVVAHTDITQGAEVIGNPVLVVNDIRYEHMVISMDLVKVKSKHEWLSNEFLYRMMRTREFKEHCLGYSNGSTVLHLSKQAIPSFEFFMPPKEKIQSYTEFAKDLFGKKFKNIEQILTLEKLRDNLLPKLMSGEVRIQDD